MKDLLRRRKISETPIVFAENLKNTCFIFLLSLSLSFSLSLWLFIRRAKKERPKRVKKREREREREYENAAVDGNFFSNVPTVYPVVFPSFSLFFPGLLNFYAAAANVNSASRASAEMNNTD